MAILLRKYLWQHTEFTMVNSIKFSTIGNFCTETVKRSGLTHDDPVTKVSCCERECGREAYLQFPLATIFQRNPFSLRKS